MTADSVAGRWPPRGVSQREAEVLAALADRLTNAEIAARLHLSERTVESHVTSLLRKLPARNRVELGDVAREILRRGPDRPPSPIPALLGVLANSARFVGRVSELGRLHDLWARAQAGRLLVGFVAGAAGMGKSRLVAELAVELHREGAQVQWTSCFEGVRVPYHPFAQAIGADIAALSKSELQRRIGESANTLAWLVPDLIPARMSPGTDEIVDPASAQAEVTAALHGYVTRSADASPLLLVVEDAHWATSTTLAAIHHLAWESGPARVLILVTTRDAAPDLDTDLVAFLADVGRLPAVDRIDLAGFTVGEVAALVGSLGSAADPAMVLDDTGGNPLFVREVAGGFCRTGTLSSLLSRRYAVLEQEAMAVLDLAAVLGSEFDAEVIATALKRPLRTVLQSLDRAEDAGLVSRSSGRHARFFFRHALFGAARYEDIASTRRTHLHRQVVAALRERAEDPSVLPELARHAVLASPTEGHAAAGRALRRWGDRGLALNDFASARHAYQGAGALLPGDDPERPAVLLGLGRALLTVAPEEAEVVLVEARDGLLGRGDAGGAAEAEIMLGELDWMGSRWDAAAAHLDRGAALVATRPPSPQTALVYAHLARLQAIAGDNGRARAYGTRALEDARLLGLRAIEANVLISVGPARVQDGDLGGIDDIEAGIELARELSSPELGRGYDNLGYVHALLGNRKQTRSWRQRAREVYERFGLTNNERWVRAHDIEDNYYDGDWDDALAGIDAFLAEVEASAHFRVTVCLRVRAQVRMGRGNQTGGLADLAAAVEYARGTSHPAGLLFALPLYARCLFEHGRTRDANAAIAETLTLGSGHENIIEPIEAALAMWGLGRQAEYLDVAARVTIPSKRWDVGRSIADGDLDRAADLLADMEHRSFEAYLRLLAAEHFAAQGRRRDADAQARRALAFHRSVGAVAYVRRGEKLTVN